MASEQALMVQEGIRAWSFVPPPLSGIEVASGSEIEFNPRVRPPCTDEDKEHYMPPINVVSRLPLPLADRNVVYFEVKVMSLPSPTASTVAIGLVSRPYPEWRHVGFNRYSVGIHNNGTIFRNSQTIPATTTLLSFSEADAISPTATSAT
ncbi:hypothetical protein GQ42DRAFT_28133 [Ramicandelaber brevisporus]|nr:hypothetical protein GQ42DRAFT_28133 [Ramicandelaber brevisporus]